MQIKVVYHTIPTSNHNREQVSCCNCQLYIILFLHQTTTAGFLEVLNFWLYIILFLHQTTTPLCVTAFYACCISYYSYIKPQRYVDNFGKVSRCISYYSYIKPQRSGVSRLETYVVYHTIPTSNHNWKRHFSESAQVVYHTIPTSNHNCH